MTDTRQSFSTGDGSRLAYVKAIRSEEVAFLCAEAPLLASGHQVYVLLAGDGTPLLLAATREEVLAAAAHNHIETVSVH